ncbi:hypothetical protein RND81_06G208400 [Saponaria officinalis]|uniref:Uncharacterized protein n=1 Tax=Saponaria officinalis TaxID=3572 RepID=A0AAW1KE10_SAPOF
MAVSFSLKTTHTRSASFPAKLNLMVEKIEIELKKLGESEELCTSELETIGIGLSGLARLYKCVDGGLKSRITKHAPVPHYVTPLVGVCSTSKEMVVSLRNKVASVRSVLETTDGKNDDECSFSLSSYVGVRKDIIRSAKEVALSLRQLELQAAENLGNESSSSSEEVSRVLTCITVINISVLRSLLGFLMTKPKHAKQGLLHKLGLGKKTSGKAATLPAKNGNKLSDVDAALVAVCVFPKDTDTLAVALKRLESMEVALAELEDGLSFICTVLSKIKSCLLNNTSL